MAASNLVCPGHLECTAQDSKPAAVHLAHRANISQCTRYSACILLQYWRRVFHIRVCKTAYVKWVKHLTSTCNAPPNNNFNAYRRPHPRLCPSTASFECCKVYSDTCGIHADYVAVGSSIIVDCVTCALEVR